MENYDYRKAMVEDIKQYIKDNPHDFDEDEDVEEYWYDALFEEDNVTGNGPYWYDTEDKCAEYLCHNIDLAYEAAREFGMDDEIISIIKYYENHELARYLDCTIRCYLLGECLYTALEELK